MGPLLFHYADSSIEPSLEVSCNEILGIIKNIGFDEVIVHDNICTNYASDPFDTMMKVSYECVFFTAIKKKDNVV